jgi:AcrR family transcriptional regulator
VAGTRERIVAASAELFRRQGYAGTGVKQIVTLAGAPFGSLYHFFPGGKEQLGEEVVRHTGALYLQLIETVFDGASDAATGVERFFAGAGAHLRETEWADASPIAALALEAASTSEPLRQATADVYETWIAALAARFAEGGIAPQRTRSLALIVLSALEGAFVLARATRSTSALESAGVAAAATVRAALADVSSR